jgi:hypothetical protein
MIPQKLRKEVAAAVVLAAAAAWTNSAWAQISAPAVVTVQGSVTQDALVEQSLTTGEGTPNFTPNAQTISTLDQTLFPSDGASPQIFPGWESCAPDCTDAGEAIDNAVMATYQGAFSVAQQQEQQLISEGDQAGTIDSNVAATTDVLAALQGVADLLAMQVQEERYIRQQNDTIITLLATHYSQDLNDSMQQLATQIATTPGQQE